MPIISVQNLSRSFKVLQKEPGVLPSLRSFIHRKYKTTDAVKDVSFSIESGELVGFIGQNGAGKTTTLKMLSGLLYPTSGKVSVLGYTPFDRKSEFLKQISLVMGQKNQLWWDLPAMDTFLLNKEIYDLPQKQFQTTLGELVELLDVKDVLKTPVRKLSLGQRMKMELIAALIHTPKVLFLDEPTIGLDVVMQANLREFIRNYNLQYGSTIILTSHYMEDVKSLCKRIIMIDHGTVAYDGLLEKVVAEYAVNKYITLELEKKVAESKLKSLGKLDSFTFPTVRYEVPRKDVLPLINTLLNELPIVDLNIEEPKIEDIIRDVFTRKKAV